MSIFDRFLRKSADAVETHNHEADRHPNGHAETGITVFDAGSQQEHVLKGIVITDTGGESEIPTDLRQYLIATSAGQIFQATSGAFTPRVQTEVLRIRRKLEVRTEIIDVDLSTIAEFYRQLNARNRARSNDTRKSYDNSRMQRDLIAIVANAKSMGASDIHIIVNRDRARVRFRVDGVMTDINEIQPQYAFELLSATFAMADASDPSYQPRSPQGARISQVQTDLPRGVQAVRLQFNPLANDGRELIMRLLDSGEGNKVNLEKLGYRPKHLELISTMISRPVGINIISGPTGSGKSTTLKAVLERIIAERRGEANIITIEDPPEYVIEDAQQMPVTNAKTQEERNAAFTAAINAGLRSDPDIMMIGEIRDRPAANLAVEGALSGHPIYASLHANSAPDILTRLRNMGIEDYKAFDPSVFSGLIAQRLVRRICRHCKRPITDPEVEKTIDPLRLKRIDAMLNASPEHLRDRSRIHVAGEGCSHCKEGYSGRAVIAEILLPDEKFMQLLRDGNKVQARGYWFETLGGNDLLGEAWIHALEGSVSPVDIENTVALIAPLPEHEIALKNWAPEA